MSEEDEFFMRDIRNAIYRFNGLDGFFRGARSCLEKDTTGWRRTWNDIALVVQELFDEHEDHKYNVI